MMFRDESNDLPGPRLPFLSLSREEGRPHVHVQGSNGEAKFWLAQNYGLTSRQKRPRAADAEGVRPAEAEIVKGQRHGALKRALTPPKVLINGGSG